MIRQVISFILTANYWQHIQRQRLYVSVKLERPPFSLCFRVHYRRPQIPSAETQTEQTVAERRGSGAFLPRLLWNDARWNLPGNSPQWVWMCFFCRWTQLQREVFFGFSCSLRGRFTMWAPVWRSDWERYSAGCSPTSPWMLTWWTRGERRPSFVSCCLDPSLSVWYSVSFYYQLRPEHTERGTHWNMLRI